MSKEIAQVVGGKRFAWIVVILAVVTLLGTLGSNWVAEKVGINSTTSATIADATNQVAATDADVGLLSTMTALYTSANIDTALDKSTSTTSSSIDPGGGTELSASLGSTNDYATTASRASPPTTLAVLDSGNGILTTTASRASPLLPQATSWDGISTNDYATTASRAGPAERVAVLVAGTRTAITAGFGAIAIILVTAAVAFATIGGVRFRWSMTRGHAQISNTVVRIAAA